MDTSLPALLVRVVVSLAVVLAVMAGAAAVLRRSGVVGTGVSGRGLRRRSVALEVLARHGLSRGSSIVVVRLGTKGLVLGVTEHRVSLLTEVDPAELDAPPDVDPGGPGVSPGQGRREPPPSVGPAGPGIGAGALPWKVALDQLRDRTVRRS